jgi:hypothetical protein
LPAVRAAVSLASWAASRVRGQPVLRLHAVVLASCPVGFEAGAFGGALE